MEMGRFPNLEKRRFPRIEDSIFIFGNSRPNSIDLRPDLIEGFKAFTRNISAGGLMFETERDIFKGSELELEIYQPLNSDKTLIFSVPVLAKVIWTREIEKEHFETGENKYRVGIEFLEIKEEDRQKIVKYVNLSNT